MTGLRSLLTGGDRRSLARSAEALALVRDAPRRVGELAALTRDSDRLVVMRAMDLLEKLAREHRAWVEPHRQLFLELADHDAWEVKLQIARALPLFAWGVRDRKRAIAILTSYLEHPQTFVRAWALDGLATFARTDPSLRDRVLAAADSFEASGSKALFVRAREARKRLASQ